MELIQAVTVGAGGAATIDFTSIPQTYTDLVIKLSSNASGSTPRVRFNSSSSSIYKEKLLYGQGNSAAGASASSNTWFEWIALGNYATSNFFGNCEFYIPNYTGSNNKTILSDGITEVNATSGNNIYLDAGLWSSGSAISVIQLYNSSGVFNQYTTAYLYGVTNVLTGPKATGGNITFDSAYYYHTFLSSGTFTPTSALTADYLIVAGGGGGGYEGAGGGGGGGCRYITSQSLTATAYAVTVGAGGAPGSSGSARGASGTNSTFNTASSSGGGGGGGNDGNPTNLNGGAGGSGGGARSNTNSSGGAGNIGSYSPVEGYAGASTTSSTGSGGGGGAGGVGQANTNGTQYGGDGGLAITNLMPGISSYYSGGGGGGVNSITPQLRGLGGGTSDVQLKGGGGDGGFHSIGATAGTANTGGGGGGGDGSSNVTGATGGSGIVIVRYAK
jgi:hypothetical protein